MGTLIGLALGVAIGVAGLAAFLPMDTSPAQPAAQAARPPPEPPPRIAAVPQPIDLPRVSIASPQPDALPNIIHPDTPPGEPGGGFKDGSAPRQPGSAYAGTGFFVASDGSLITAAHVVTDCRQVRIVSRLVRPAVAELLAADPTLDIALLRAARVTPPATLAVGRPVASSRRLFVLGYPADGGPLVPSEAWATLENDQLQPAPLTDPGNVVWLEAPAIGPGYSGGPMLDPNNGNVVGIVRATVDSTALHAARTEIPQTGMVIGPGSRALTGFLRREVADSDLSLFANVSGADALDAARRATVHVLCLP